MADYMFVRIMPMVRRANQLDDNLNELCYDIQ